MNPATALEQQIRFIVEIDRLKTVLRQNYLVGGSRRENTAEHSWHVTLMAMVLSEHAAAPVDRARVLELLLVHDLVEIDAGDTFAYDSQGSETKIARE
ncbi:HD domain-containing protein, partial [bacterium]|nr:HD domain-containing protein [bacterium]